MRSIAAGLAVILYTGTYPIYDQNNGTPEGKAQHHSNTQQGESTALLITESSKLES